MEAFRIDIYCNDLNRGNRSSVGRVALQPLNEKTCDDGFSGQRLKFPRKLMSECFFFI